MAHSKRVALLVYLALARPRGLQPRATLLTLFWPEATEERGRAALSQALYFLRRPMGEDVVLTQGDTVGLDHGLVWCDAVALEAAVEAGDAQRALELYQGDFLPGFHTDASPRLEQWLDAERRRLRALAARAAWSLVDRARDSGAHAVAAEAARRAYELDPLDEPGLRRLLAALVAANDRAGAVAAYEAAAQRWRDELELDLSPETEAAIQAVRVAPAANAREPVAYARTTHPLAVPGVPAPEAPAELPVSRSNSTVARRRHVAVASALALAVAVTAAVALSARDPVAPGYAPRPKRVLVLDFEPTSAAAGDAMGRMAADRIATELARTGLVDVVPSTALMQSTRPAAGDSSRLPQALARATGAGIIVTGSYYRDGAALALHARIFGADGRLLRAVEHVSRGASAVDAVDTLRRKITGALASLLDQRLASWTAAASQPPSMEAYQSFSDGLDLFLRLDRESTLEAALLFRAAARYDTSFSMPLIWAARAYHNAGQHASLDSVLAVLTQRRARLAPWDRAMLEFLQANRREDRAAAYRAMRRVVAIAPGSDWVFHLAVEALAVNRPREAVALLERLGPDHGWVREWLPYWITLLDARHRLGDYERELQDARRMRERHPRTAWAELTALAGFGSAPEILRIADSLLARTAPANAWRPWPLRAVHELRAHGHVDAADSLARRVLVWYDGAAADVRRGEFTRSTRATLLMLVDRDEEARALLEQLLGERPEFFEYLGALGVIAARRGDRAAAERYMRRITDGATMDIGERLGVAAGILAMLGDRERAIQTLREAFERGLAHHRSLHLRPDFEPLRAAPAFRALMQPAG